MKLLRPSFLGLLFLSLASTVHAEALTLEDAYFLALSRSEDIAIQKELMSTADAHTYQSLDTIMPKAHFVMTRFEQDVPAGTASSDGSIAGSLLRRRTPTDKFTLSQPLFSGFKEVAVLKAVGVEKSQRRYEMQRGKELLFMEVVDAYYTLAGARKDIQILTEIHEVLGKRIEDLTSRAELGRSRDSEVQSGIAELKVVEAELEIAKGNERIAAQLLEFYVGRDVTEALADEEGLEEEIKDTADLLGYAQKRADVLAKKDAKTLSVHNVTAARSGLFPKAQVDGNYYTERVGFQSEIEWDVLLTIDVPLFEGTRVIGDIKEAASQRQIAGLELDRAKRLAELDIRTAFETFKASGSEEKALAAAAEASQKNYDMHAQEYGYHLVNNLDVLDALRQYENIRRRLNLSRYESIKNFWRLKVAMGNVFINEKAL